MTDQKQIQMYVNNFRRRFTPYLKPGLGLSCRILMAKDFGAIIEFSMGLELKNDDYFEEEYTTLVSALSTIKQRAFGGNLEGFVFVGTNIILEPDRIIFIKDDNLQEWSDSAAEKDLNSVLLNGQGAKI